MLARSAQLEQQLAVDEVPSSADPIHDDCARAELTDAVRRAVNSLPEEQRTVILLREYQGFSYREIAEVTGGTEEAVRVRAHRARQALRALLTPYLGDEAGADVTFALS